MKKQKDISPVRSLTAVALVAAVGLASVVWAETADSSESSKTVYALTKESSDAKNNAFAIANSWADYSSGAEVSATYAPNSSSAAGLEYIITNSLTARTQARSDDTYYGHITVGTANSAGGIGNKSYQVLITYKGGLTVVNGQYTPISNGGDNTLDNAGKTTAQIGGTIEVLSPSSNPFWFGADKNCQGVAIYADITGAESTGIILGSKAYTFPKKALTISGDNAAFLGSIEFGGGTLVTNIVGSATALGGAPSTLNAEAVKFSSPAESVIRFSSSVGTCQIPANRGIYLNGVGNKSYTTRTFRFDLEDGANVEVLGPFKASGDTSNKSLTIEKLGAGTLTLSGDVSLENADTFNLNVNEGRLVLGSTTAWSLAKELSNAVWIKSPSAAETALSGYTLGEGAGFVVRHENGAAGTIVLDSTCKIDATPINIQLETDQEGYDAYEVCVLKVPTSIKTLTAEDFEDADTAGVFGVGKTTFRVETAEDDTQSVYMCRAANNTIAYLSFEDGFTSSVRTGTLNSEPTVQRTGATLSDDVSRPRLTLHGDKETVLGENTKSLSVNGGILKWTDVGDLLKYDSQTIEFYIKANPQNRYQIVLSLANGRSSNATIWSFLFDSGDDTSKNNPAMRVSHCWVPSEGADPKNSGSAIAAQTVGDGKWHHIAYTIAPNASDEWKTDLKYYIDHKLVASATADGKLCLEPSDGATFGIAVDSRSANTFDGLLDEIRISRGALEPDQFLQLRTDLGLAIIVR